MASLYDKLRKCEIRIGGNGCEMGPLIVKQKA